MSRLSMNEMTTYRWSFEEDVEHYRAAGLDGIGVWRRKLSDFGEERGVELLADSGLAVSNLLWAGGFTGSDGRTFRESVDDALEALRLAQAMRARCLVIYSGPRAGHTHNHARRLLRDALKQLLPAAEEAAVPLAIEPMHPGCAEEWTSVDSLEAGLALCDEFASPWLRLALDTYHLGWDEDAPRRIAAVADRIAVVHLGDGRTPPSGDQSRTKLGEGVLPLAEIVAALTRAGYDGFFDVELLGEEIEPIDYDELIEHSRRAFCELQGRQTV